MCKLGHVTHRIKSKGLSVYVKFVSERQNLHINKLIQNCISSI
jgi:hypothetical protein